MAGARGGTAPLAHRAGEPQPAPMSGSSGHRARKRFGQHFLHDPNVLESIVAAVSPNADDHLIEIGPGRGVLTRLLLAAQAGNRAASEGIRGGGKGALDAIEID